jgi:hypothetical protein
MAGVTGNEYRKRPSYTGTKEACPGKKGGKYRKG